MEEPKNEEVLDESKVFKDWLSVLRKLPINTDVSNFIKEMGPAMEILSDAKIAAFIFDYSHANYLYFNRHFAQLMNMKPEQIIADGINIMKKNVHPDDFLKCLNIFQKSTAEFKKMKDFEKKSFQMRLFYRLKVKKNQYCWVMQSNSHLVSEDKNSRTDTGFILELFDARQPLKVMAILDTNYRRIELFPDGEMDLLSKLSQRELEILQLAKQGLVTKDISEHLSITQNTVKAHRRNLIKKLNVRNMLQATGIIDKI